MEINYGMGEIRDRCVVDNEELEVLDRLREHTPLRPANNIRPLACRNDHQKARAYRASRLLDGTAAVR